MDDMSDSDVEGGPLSFRQYLRQRLPLWKRKRKSSKPGQSSEGGSGSAEDSTIHSWQALLSISRKANSLVKRKQFLDSLEIPALGKSNADIKEAYHGTFDWVFENASHRFLEWLGSGTGIFWITGKSGSRKSTLIKFIYSHSRIREFLEKWAGSMELLVVYHCFWNTGESSQKSREGFLRSLLFQILSKKPDRIEPLWIDKHQDEEPPKGNQWSLQDLSILFRALVDEGSFNARVCVFVDGLDEYDGNPAEIISLLDEIARSPCFKLCVSSRPWLVFEHKFGTSNEKLRLDDLMRNDIKHYVESRLEGNELFNRLSIEDPNKTEEIPRVLVRNADGVFQWAEHMVNLLLQDASYVGSASELLSLARSYPRGLDVLSAGDDRELTNRLRGLDSATVSAAF